MRGMPRASLPALAVCLGALLLSFGCAGARDGVSYADRPFAVDDRHADPWIASSFAGVTPAQEFPADARWANVDPGPTIESLRGKIVIVDFWTYGCINCIHNLPVLKELSSRYADEVVVIGVHSAKFPQEGNRDALRSVLRRFGITYPVLNDRDRRVMEQWGARAWPTLFLIDPAGNVAGKETGEGFERKFERAILSLIREFDERGELDRSPRPSLTAELPDGNQLLAFPQSVLATKASLFVADTGHHRILEVDRVTGAVLRAFGSGKEGFVDGPAEDAAFSSPRGPALSDGRLYVADTGNHAVRAIELATGAVGTVAGTGSRGYHYPPRPGPLPGVSLRSPWDIAVDGSILYVAMAGSHQLWWIDLDAASAGYLAGSGVEGVKNGPAPTAHLAQPSGLALATDGPLYFADSESSSVRAFSGAPDTPGEVWSVAGATDGLFTYGLVDGRGSSALFQHPTSLDVAGRMLYVADTYNHALRVVDRETFEVRTFAGGEPGWSDGEAAMFNEPSGIDVEGNVAYVADTNNHAIRRVDLDTGVVSTLLLTTEEPDPIAVPRDQHRLGGVSVSRGVIRVLVRVALPEGHKLQPATASRISVSVGDRPARTAEATSFPATVSLEAPARNADLSVDMWIAYCESEREERCFFDQVRYVVPLEVDGTSTAGRRTATDRQPTDRIEITHDVTPPSW